MHFKFTLNPNEPMHRAQQIIGISLLTNYSNAITNVGHHPA